MNNRVYPKNIFTREVNRINIAKLHCPKKDINHLKIYTFLFSIIFKGENGEYYHSCHIVVIYFLNI